MVFWPKLLLTLLYPIRPLRLTRRRGPRIFARTLPSGSTSALARDSASSSRLPTRWSACRRGTSSSTLSATSLTGSRRPGPPETVCSCHRRRIKTGKGRRWCLGGRIDSFLCRASSMAPGRFEEYIGWIAQGRSEESDELHQDDMKNIDFIPFFKLSWRGKEYVPQTAVTTFAFFYGYCYGFITPRWPRHSRHSLAENWLPCLVRLGRGIKYIYREEG